MPASGSNAKAGFPNPTCRSSSRYSGSMPGSRPRNRHIRATLPKRCGAQRPIPLARGSSQPELTPSPGPEASLPAGLLILRRELPAGLDPEGSIRRQDAVLVHVFVREEERIFGDDAASQLEGRGIEREALDDMQLVAVRQRAS